jgi:hypothetical protein
MRQLHMNKLFTIPTYWKQRIAKLYRMIVHHKYAIDRVYPFTSSRVVKYLQLYKVDHFMMFYKG